MGILSSSRPDVHKICDECGKEFQAVMEIGEEMAWDSDTAWLCMDCLKEAVKRLERFMEKTDAN